MSERKPTPDESPPRRDLLSYLDSDPLKAAKEYRRLRLKLVKYFEWNDAAAAEEMTDETILRVVEKLAEGREIYARKPANFVFGVARNVLREGWKRRRNVENRTSPLDAGDSGEANPGRHELVQELNRLDRKILLQECLAILTDSDRDLIVRFYTEGAETLAKELGVSTNAIRIRTCRINRKIRNHCGGSWRRGRRPEDK